MASKVHYTSLITHYLTVDLYWFFGDRSRVMIIKTLELGPMGNFAYLLGDEEERVCAVIDPGWEIEKIVKLAEKEGFQITHILLTHTHFDHARGVSVLADRTSATVYVHNLESSEIDVPNKQTFDNDDEIMVGKLKIKCIHTPGHTQGSTCFMVDGVIFTGDTLFVDAIGRTDLEGSNPDDMFKSLKKLSTLPDKIVIYAGHNYGNEPTSTIGEQKKRNPYMKVRY